MTQDELYEEYNEWLEAHGLHDEEEPPEDTLVGYDEDGEEIHLPAMVHIWSVGADFGYEAPEAYRLGSARLVRFADGKEG